MKKISNFKAGFTLIELLIVIVIIGVLASLLMANFVGIRERARDGQRKSDLRQIQSALEMYRSDQGLYPTSAPSSPYLPACGASLTGGSATYMQKTPCDPLNLTPTPYYYNSNGNTYSLKTCLENINDSQKDSTNDNVVCTDTTTRSFTLQNP